jgi:hypothetical protein
MDVPTDDQGCPDLKTIVFANEEIDKNVEKLHDCDLGDDFAGVDALAEGGKVETGHWSEMN